MLLRIKAKESCLLDNKLYYLTKLHLQTPFCFLFVYLFDHFVFEVGSHYVVQAGLKVATVLPQPPK